MMAQTEELAEVWGFRGRFSYNAKSWYFLTVVKLKMWILLENRTGNVIRYPVH
jgi:hypothetical protein